MLASVLSYESISHSHVHGEFLRSQEKQVFNRHAASPGGISGVGTIYEAYFVCTATTWLEFCCNGRKNLFTNCMFLCPKRQFTCVTMLFKQQLSFCIVYENILIKYTQKDIEIKGMTLI